MISALSSPSSIPTVTELLGHTVPWTRRFRGCCLRLECGWVLKRKSDCCTVYYTVLHCCSAVLYCTILRCGILKYTVLYWVALSDCNIYDRCNIIERACAACETECEQCWPWSLFQHYISRLWDTNVINIIMLTEIEVMQKKKQK